ncbi:PH domain-containing protein [Lepidopterella palustris CBS 459.81]|uniref:PH domain-containing protein n=1 Tax=Lepidopterella palustris CBS 459.81 TaxID=1314670 RepID=A0A8E2JJB6_9PEZI|nr:PH domain-containing protein [Lepidopterella palustris CBS 459.81]
MSSPQTNLPTRTFTNGSDDEAVPGEDTSEVTRLFQERLQAWKHAIVYLEDYITATEKMQNAHGKEYEKVLKTVSRPLKEGQHFDQALGGVAGMFENIRSNTQGILNSHYDTAKQIKGSILPIFERLHTEIKNKNKELTKGAGKQSKAVDKARNITQKHIELLGQYTAAYDSTGGSMSATNDPYVLQRGVMHRLNKQIMEENNNRQDLITVQNSFAQFEAHIIQVMQQGMGQFMQVVSSQTEQTRAMYGDIVGTAQRIQTDFEWNGFIKRNDGILINPSAPPRSLSNISFPNQNHRATQPLIAGSLERKGKLLKKYDTNYYVVTPSKFLHEFKTDDDFAKDPTPELSLYLPDCIVGGINGAKFNVKGKDVSKGKVGNTFSMSHELAFKAHTSSAANQWWEVIRQAAGQVTNEMPETSAPGSPVSPSSTEERQPAPLNTQVLANEKETHGSAHPTSAHPTSAQPMSAGVGDGVHATDAADAVPTSGVERKPGEY